MLFHPALEAGTPRGLFSAPGGWLLGYCPLNKPDHERNLSGVLRTLIHPLASRVSGTLLSTGVQEKAGWGSPPPALRSSGRAKWMPSGKIHTGLKCIEENRAVTQIDQESRSPSLFQWAGQAAVSGWEPRIKAT